MSEPEKIQSPEPAVVGDTPAPAVGPHRSHKRLYALIAVVVIVLLIFGGAFWLMAHRTQQQHQQHQQQQAKAKASSLSDDYESLTSSQIDTKLQAVDLTDDYIKHGDLSKLDFDQAYAAAQALYAYNMYDRSEQAYKIADQQAPKDVDYMFYDKYAQAALYASDKPQWIKELDKEKQVIQSSSLSDSYKKTLLDRITVTENIYAQEKAAN